MNQHSSDDTFPLRELRCQVLSTLLLFSLLGLALWRWALTILPQASLFLIREIALPGCPPPVRAEVGQEVKRLLGQSLVHVWWQRRPLEEQLTLVPSVRHVELRCCWPNGLLVRVFPRYPILAARCRGQYYHLDAERVVVRITKDPPDLPLVWGLPLEGYGPGEQVEETILQPTLECLAAAHRQHLDLHTVALSAGGGLRVRTVQENHLVILGQPRGLEQKLRLFTALRQALQQKGYQFEYIDVSLPSAPICKLVEGSPVPG